eukprot:5351305-Pyramimonas_sp.AAC.1
MLTKGLGPMTRATEGPVLTLLRATWERWIPRHAVEHCLNRSQAEHWSQVKGPFSAVKMTLARAGWK